MKKYQQSMKVFVESIYIGTCAAGLGCYGYLIWIFSYFADYHPQAVNTAYDPLFASIDWGINAALPCFLDWSLYTVLSFMKKDKDPHVKFMKESFYFLCSLIIILFSILLSRFDVNQNWLFNAFHYMTLLTCSLMALAAFYYCSKGIRLTLRRIFHA